MAHAEPDTSSRPIVWITGGESPIKTHRDNMDTNSQESVCLYMDLHVIQLKLYSHGLYVSSCVKDCRICRKFCLSQDPFPEAGVTINVSEF